VDFRLPDSASAGTGRCLFGGAFDIFLMMLREQMRTSSSSFSVIAGARPSQ
jgi:hypothetical protein